MVSTGWRGRRSALEQALAEAGEQRDLRAAGDERPASDTPITGELGELDELLRLSGHAGGGDQPTRGPLLHRQPAVEQVRDTAVTGQRIEGAVGAEGQPWMFRGHQFRIPVTQGNPVLVILAEQPAVVAIVEVAVRVKSRQVQAQTISGSHHRLPLVLVCRPGSSIIRRLRRHNEIGCRSADITSPQLPPAPQSVVVGALTVA
ncbi:hypothetical protein AB0B94_20900 [Micromonospora sp. NPDC048986]|uniref:hypothetical protein n=1 Tax=Micromonospora sp. NPDC048986 TaxID=3155644 RepID=UPI0033CA5B73